MADRDYRVGVLCCAGDRTFTGSPFYQRPQGNPDRSYFGFERMARVRKDIVAQGVGLPFSGEAA